MYWRRSIQLLLLITNLSGIILVAGMSEVWVELRAPRFVVHRHSAELRCEHNVDPESIYKTEFGHSGRSQRRLANCAGHIIVHKCVRKHNCSLFLHSQSPVGRQSDTTGRDQAQDQLLNVHSEARVVFFKNGQRFMKFIRERDPQYELYNITGAEIDLKSLSATSLKLSNLDFTASGPYACEIALETPLYSKLSKIHELNVIVRQKYRPKIKLKHKKLSPNEHLQATCQSSPAHPAPHLTWFINNMKVDERLTTPHGTMSVHRHHHGIPLSITSSSLAFPLTSLELSPNQTVAITCLSTIPSYASLGEGFADVQNNTVTVHVVRNEPAPTQLPVKIVSSELNLSARCRLERMLYVLVILVCHIYS